MTAEEYEALKVGDTIYRYDDGIRSYTIDKKNPQSINLDRICPLSSAVGQPFGGTKMLRPKVLKCFWVSELDAVRAEIKRVDDLIAYHQEEERIAVEAMQVLVVLEGAAVNEAGAPSG